jgi:hypothetical protein
VFLRFLTVLSGRLCTAATITSLLVLSLSGCGSSGGSAEIPAAEQITAYVVYGDQPVGEGSVNLVMDGTGNGAFGDLDAEGHVTLTNVPLGSYTVIVMPPAEKDPDPENPVPVKTYNNIPPKFRSQTSSPLKADITAETKTLEFNLKQ